MTNEITDHHQLITCKEDKNNIIENDIEDDDIEDDDIEDDGMKVDDIDTEAGTCGSQEDDMTINSDITDHTEEIPPLSFKRKREIEFERNILQ
jgi:hypothetical protein